MATKSPALSIGDEVRVNEGLGCVQFIGETSFAPGAWVGIALKQSGGKNDGSVQGKAYFKCKPSHGIFVNPSKVELIDKGSSKKAEIKKSLSRAVEEHDLEEMHELIREGIECGMPMSDLESAQRVFYSDMQTSMFAEIEDVQNAIADLLQSVDKSCTGNAKKDTKALESFIEETLVAGVKDALVSKESNGEKQEDTKATSQAKPHEVGTTAIDHSTCQAQVKPNGGTATIWSGNDVRELLRVPNKDREEVYTVKVFPCGTKVLTAYFGGPVSIWDAASGEELVCLAGARHPADIFPCGNQVVACSSDHPSSLHVWNVASGEKLHSFDVDVACVAVFPAGDRIVGGALLNRGAWKHVVIVDVATKNEVLFEAHKADVRAAAVFPDGERVATGDGTGYIFVWSATTAKAMRIIPAHNRNGVRTLSICPKTDRIVSCGGDGKAYVWDSASGQELAQFSNHQAQCDIKSPGYRGDLCGALFPDGDYVVTGNNINGSPDVRVWDSRTGAQVWEHIFQEEGMHLGAGRRPSGAPWPPWWSKLTTHIFSVSCFPDGQRIAVTTRMETVIFGLQFVAVLTVCVTADGVVVTNVSGDVVERVPFSDGATFGMLRDTMQQKYSSGLKLISAEGALLGSDIDPLPLKPDIEFSSA